jgi:hypothetical protein
MFAFLTVVTTFSAVLQAANPNIRGFLASYILSSVGILGTLYTRYLLSSPAL